LGSDSSPAREIPLRPLPFGSEGVVTSPTYVAQSPAGSGAVASEATPRTTIEDASYTGPGVMWEKDEGFPTQDTPLGPSEEEKDVLET
jgi:glycogenin glucosyltransferase